jgi:serine/threonine protein kinase
MANLHGCSNIGFMENSQVENLVHECAKMSVFDHPNVLTLVGVCLDGGPAPYLIMPFMFNGSLLSYLKKKRADLVLSPQHEIDIYVVSSNFYRELIKPHKQNPVFMHVNS